MDFPECPPAELARFLARKSVSGDAQHLGSGVMTQMGQQSGARGTVFFFAMDMDFERFSQLEGHFLHHFCVFLIYMF